MRGLLKMLSQMKFFISAQALMIAAVFLYFSSVPGGLPSARAAENNEVLSLLKPAEEFELSTFAEDLPVVRLMVMTGTGNVIVSQPGLGEVTLLFSDGNADGVSDGRVTLVKGLRKPHGLALDGNYLYVAAETKVVRYKFDEKARRVTSDAELMFEGMPTGGHSTRTIAKGPDGYFYVSVGSSCNVCVERHKWRATIVRFKPNEEVEIYATGLRNTVGYDWHPLNGELYSVDNGRDWLGDDLPPEEVNKITKGGFYGWPYFYGDSVRDNDFGGNYSEKQHGKPIGPVHVFGAHIAPLSLKFHQSAAFLNGDTAAALVAQHGSWNRSKPAGYKVVRLGFDETGKITQTEFLSGFLRPNGRPVGRPVDSLSLEDGSILISDDQGGVIWRMKPKS